MPDPADRIRAPSKTARAKPARAKWARGLMPKSKRTVAGAALAAMMVAIVVNAVALQHGRRLILGPLPTAMAAVRPSAPVATPAPAPVAPAKAAPTPTAVALAHTPKSDDPIADFLRAQNAEKRRLTHEAQGALAKLGFSVKATGALDAPTRSALITFEKSHHLPHTAQISAKLVRSLTAAAAAN